MIIIAHVAIIVPIAANSITLSNINSKNDPKLSNNSAKNNYAKACRFK